MGAQKRRGLGRSLNVLLSSDSTQQDAQGESRATLEIPLDRLQAGAHQPRRRFDDEALAELSQSIAAQGVIQPIIVRGVGEGRYEIVAGERRWRAARLAGLKDIPAVVRDYDERGAMAVALVENIQRADLNPVEEAEGLRKLLDDCHLTHEQVAEAVGRSRAAVSNLLRVLELNPDVRQMLSDERLSLGHAKVLLGAQGARQSELAVQVAEQQLSVRQTEALLKAEPAREPPARVNGAEASQAELRMQSELSERLGLKVQVKRSAKGRGKMTISFRNDQDWDRFLQKIS